MTSATAAAPFGTALRRWVHALKPASWPKLWLPTAVGLGLGAAVMGRVDPVGLALGVAFTVADGFYILFLNDVSDEHVDRLKRRLFAHGCSPKTIPDGLLSRRQVLAAGLLGLGGAGIVAALALAAGRPSAAALIGVGLAVFAAYSLPPVRLNYRGGGEALEALGVGAVLPLVQSALQGAPLSGPLAWFLVPSTLGAASSAVASGLADEESDRLGGKTTMATWLGNARARRLVERLSVASGVASLLVAAALAGAAPWAAAGSAAAGALSLLRVRRLAVLGQGAVMSAFGPLHAYKHELHRTLWRAQWLVAAGLAAQLLAGRP